MEQLSIPRSPVETFSWKNCGAATDAVQIVNLNLSPDPVVLNGNVTVSGGISVATKISSPVKVDLKLYKKVFGKYEAIPCIGGVGSCTYDDICAKLPSTCPAGWPAGIPCSCPFAEGTYSIPTTSFALHVGNLPSWASDGDYEAQATGTDSSGNELFCVNVQVSIKDH